MAMHFAAEAGFKLFGIELRIEHVFSCEIEPEKQAYIETNFKPPILYRDVTELPSGVGTTAYGGRREVPDHIDLVVAGTSCVDNSSLNSSKKSKTKNIHGTDGDGESADTFRAALKTSANMHAKIIIFENTAQAPFGKMVEAMGEHGYDATFVLVDTKGNVSHCILIF